MKKDNKNLMLLKEGEKIKINRISMEVTRNEAQITSDNKNKEINEEWNEIFLIDEKNQEYLLIISNKKPAYVTKIRRKHSSAPLEYTALEEIKIKSIKKIEK